MANILIACELGGNLGHLSKVLLLARSLRARGHRVAAAVRDPKAAARLFAPEGLAFVASPLLRSVRSRGPIGSYAGILAGFGYADPERLGHAVAAWKALISRTRTDFVVADHAPTALLGARAAGVLAVSVGTGFENPPPSIPLPGFFSSIDREALLATEGAVLVGVNSVLAAHSVAALPALGALFYSTKVVLATLPVLDPYGPRAGVDYFGPLYMDEGEDAVWPEAGSTRVFVYLKGPAVETVLRTLTRLKDLCVLAYLPGFPESAYAQAIGGSELRFRRSDLPVRIGSVLADADLVISNGGHGLAAACFEEGVSLAAAPNTMEQRLTAERLEAVGAASVIEGPVSEGRVVRAVERWRGRRRRAVRMKVAAVAQTADRIAARIEEDWRLTTDINASDVQSWSGSAGDLLTFVKSTNSGRAA